LAFAAAPVGAAGPSSPSPGAAGLGDRLLPGLGNGGYDVLSYHLNLRYATSASSQPIDGAVTIVARATQALSRFNLDFAGQSVGGVSVNRRPATWIRDGEELVVTPKRPVRNHRLLVIRIRDFTAVPAEPDPVVPFIAPFFFTPHGSATFLQPFFAHRVFPCNDHPRDKASFTFRFDVPAGITAVANGTQTSRRTRGGRTIWRYLQRQPMATQVTQLAVGSYDLTRRGRQRGVLVRDVTAPTLTASLEPKLALQFRHLDWMEGRVGRYPFDVYGSLVPDVRLAAALETQTLSLIDGEWFKRPQGVWESAMLHELAHSWFGNSVSVWEWSDLWLSEGHASWYEFLHAEERGFLKEDTTNYPNPTGYADFDDLMRAVYALGDQWRAQFGPVARPLNIVTAFSLNAYHGGALVLYALREKIGERAFQRLQLRWLDRYRGRSASTADFIALASRVAGRDLTAFLRAWLYDVKTPPMPGHPDWTVLPLEQPGPSVQSLQAAGHTRMGLER
jgi:aminopeptidase N